MDKHGNEWEDKGVYLCEIAWDSSNLIHKVVVQARVVGPVGWSSATGRPHGEVDLWLWNPSYEPSLRHSRLSPDKVYYLHILTKLDFTFGYDDQHPNVGKTPWQLVGNYWGQEQRRRRQLVGDNWGPEEG